MARNKGGPKGQQTIKIITAAGAPATKKGKKKNKNKTQTQSIGSQLQRLDTLKVNVLKELLNNPCGDIPREIASVAGTGLVRVVRQIITLHTTPGNGNGYLVWFPSYHHRGSQSNGVPSVLNTGGNVFAFEAPALSGAPTTNAVLNPLWADGTPSGLRGCTFTDPVYPVLGTTFRDAATLAACMKFRYVGQTSANQGTIGCIEQIDIASFIMTDGSNYFGPSITAMVSYAETRDRVQMESSEVKWAPTNGAGTNFRGTGDNGANNTLSNATDTLVRVGVSAVTFTQLAENAPSSNTGIGFVYTGLNSGFGGDVEIELIKVVQLRIAPVTGMRESETIAPSGDLFNKATQALDAVNPGWRVTAGQLMQTASNVAMNSLSNAALAGVQVYASRARRLRNM